MTYTRHHSVPKESTLGLVPAAGFATRLGGMSVSKELLRTWRPRVASEEARPAIHCLLTALEVASVARTVIVYREGKEDIPDTLGSITDGGMELEYIRVRETPSPPYTLTAAIPRMSEATVVMGFPDILFEPLDSVRRLLDVSRSTDADVVLGLFPHPGVRRADLVETEADGFVRTVQPGGTGPAGAWTWGLVAWKPRFSRFLERFVAGVSPTDPRRKELSVGDVLSAAAGAGLAVRWTAVSDVPFLDIGTPESLAEAYRRLQDLGNQNR